MTEDPTGNGGPPRTPEDILSRAVYSSDGRFLGKATELKDQWFRLDVPQELDYWLPYSAVRAIVHDQVLLDLDSTAARRRSRLEHPTSAGRRQEHEAKNRLFEWADARDEEGEDDASDSSEGRADRPFDWAESSADVRDIERPGRDAPPSN